MNFVDTLQGMDYTPYCIFLQFYYFRFCRRKTMTIAIAQPPWTSLGKRLESTLRKALFDFEMLKDVSKLAIALSGGKDSLSLLFLMKAISGRGFPDLDLYAIHVSGEFSCGAGVDENYLRFIC